MIQMINTQKDMVIYEYKNIVNGFFQRFSLPSI
jgi:hypothetical protein